MNRSFSLIFLILIACGSPKEKVSEPVLLNSEKFAEVIQNEPEILLIDVRTPQEYQNGFIEGAVNIDIRGENFEGKIKHFDRETPVAVYCAKGGRSGEASKILHDLGFKEVYDLEGGYTSWSENTPQ